MSSVIRVAEFRFPPGELIRYTARFSSWSGEFLASHLKIEIDGNRNDKLELLNWGWVRIEDLRLPLWYLVDGWNAFLGNRVLCLTEPATVDIAGTEKGHLGGHVFLKVWIRREHQLR